jgi:hypothetical protein
MKYRKIPTEIVDSRDITMEVKAEIWLCHNNTYFLIVVKRGNFCSSFFVVLKKFLYLPYRKNNKKLNLQVI